MLSLLFQTPAVSPAPAGHGGDGMSEYFREAASMKDAVSTHPPVRGTKPVIVTSGPQIKKLCKLDLDYGADHRIAVTHDAIILKDYSKDKLVKYSTSNNNIQKVWCKDLPK